jgi:hypothetical protein
MSKLEKTQPRKLISAGKKTVWNSRVGLHPVHVAPVLFHEDKFIRTQKNLGILAPHL